ncbi:MAG: serine/threonine protein kinase [Acidobacteriota bacterium]
MTATTVQPTDLFLGLTPERVLAAVEAAGFQCRPVCYPLNSFENRVYEVELEDRSRRVAKFYRPGRWSREQILAEHEFLAELDGEEIPVCPALPFPDGGTLRTIDGIHYALFERKGGRAPDELDDRSAERLGMLVGRMHAVGARHPADSRVRISGDSFVLDNLRWLDDAKTVSAGVWPRYRAAAVALADLYDGLSEGIAVQRVHGDLHLGNVLLRDGQLRLLDFDDMAMAPPVQDCWLALPGRDRDTLHQRELFLEGYEQFRSFDFQTLRLIEPLRGLRLVHYATWLAKRWHDPIFPRTWTHFGTEEYWTREAEGLEEVLAVIEKAAEPAVSGAARSANARSEEPELSNKDYFWDWEEK